MTHLPFVAGSYGLTIAAIVVFAVSSAVRLGRARRLLVAAEAARPTRRGGPRV